MADEDNNTNGLIASLFGRGIYRGVCLKCRWMGPDRLAQTMAERDRAEHSAQRNPPCEAAYVQQGAGSDSTLPAVTSKPPPPNKPPGTRER